MRAVGGYALAAMDVLILLVSLVVVTVGAEALVRGASALALRARLSPLFVGLTIVGFGTSTPELGASVTATLAGSSDMSVGNVVGSNVFNIGVILGASALLRPIQVQLGAVRRDLIVALAAALALLLTPAFGGVVPRAGGIVLVSALAVYLTYAFRAARRAPRAETALADEELRDALQVGGGPEPLLGAGKSAALVLFGLVCLVVGSRWFVGAALNIARAAGISELVIGLTVVSAGTSLPELVTSLVAARRGSADIAVGNVIGSNIFNVLGILGIAAILGPQSVGPSVLMLDVPVLIVATLALVPILRSGGRISRVEGGVLCAGYALYLAAQLVRGG